MWVPTPDGVKAALSRAQANPENTVKRIFKVASASNFDYELTQIKTMPPTFESLFDVSFTAATPLPTVESTSLNIFANTTKGNVYYIYEKNNNNTYIVTSERTFLHKKYVTGADSQPIQPLVDYILLSTHITSALPLADLMNLTFVAKVVGPVIDNTYIAVYKRNGRFVIYTAPNDILTVEGPKFVPASQTQQTTVVGATVGGAIVGGATVGGATVGGATVGGATVGGATVGGATVGGATVGGATVGGATVGGATGNGVPSTVSATTLATTPCAGPYERAINTYNAYVLKPPATGKPIACSTAATEAKTKLTVTITPSVPIALGSVTFKDVPMEKKDDAWFGFMMIAPTTASSSQWIQLEVKEQKLSYTACLGQCDATSPAYEQKKDLEVKHDKDKKYKFEGGTVEYTEEDPFHKGNLTLILGLSLGLGLGIPVLLFIIFALAYAFSPKTQKLVKNGLSSVHDYALERLPLLSSANFPG
jgi:hypothetical protein